MKTIQDFAAILNGRQRRKEITKEEAKEAKELALWLCMVFLMIYLN